MPAEAEALGSLDDSSGAAVVDGSTGGAAVLALLRSIAQHMIFESQTCNSKLICVLERLSRRVQVRDACFTNLHFASLLCFATARRKLLLLIRIADDALTGPSCSRATCSIRGRCARCCPHFWDA